MKVLKALPFGLLFLPAMVLAQDNELDFPTFDRVGFAMVCMDSHGGPSVETMTACSCRIDYIDRHMTYEDYDEASTYLRYKGMPGEKGALFRDMPRGEELLAKLNKVRDEAVKACPIAKRSPDTRE